MFIVPAACPADTILDLSLTADLAGGPFGTTLPQGTILCVNTIGLATAEILPSGSVVTFALSFDGAPTPPAPGTCPARHVVAVVASGTTAGMPITIGDLGICVEQAL